MVDVMEEAEAAELMIEQIEANQQKKAQEKAAKHARNAERVAQAEAKAQEVAARVAAGDVASAKTGEPVSVAPEFDPNEEAKASAKVDDALRKDGAAREEKRNERRSQRSEAFGKEVREEAEAANKISASVKNTFEHLKAKFTR